MWGEQLRPGAGIGVRLKRSAPKKKIVGVRWEATVLEEPKQVVELAVYVAADLNGRLKLQQGRLSCQDCCTLLKQIRHLVTAQAHVSARFLCRKRQAGTQNQAGKVYVHMVCKVCAQANAQ